MCKTCRAYILYTYDIHKRNFINTSELTLHLYTLYPLYPPIHTIHTIPPYTHYTHCTHYTVHTKHIYHAFISHHETMAVFLNGEKAEQCFSIRDYSLGT